ncbi:hypothetical protein ACER0C_002453 [Sarotherodon galilaeus]
MWLNCGSSNNDPGIIAKYYMALRSDHGDELAGAHSHMYGTSTTNQRIESWWSLFRKQRTQFWIKLFSDLRERHLFNGIQRCLEHSHHPTCANLVVHLVNQKSCITYLIGMVEESVDSKCLKKSCTSLITFYLLSTVYVGTTISRFISQTRKDRVSSLNQSTGLLQLKII